MNLHQTIELHARLEHRDTPQKDNAAMVGKPYRVVDQGYGHVISEHDTYQDAYTAMMARPGSKILTQPELKQTQENRNKVFEYSQQHNSDLDAGGAGSGCRGDDCGRKPGTKMKHKLVWECQKCGRGVYKKDIKKSPVQENYCPECGEKRRS